MGKDFEITIRENTEKAKAFMEVLGTLTVCVKSPIREYISTPHHEKVLAYFLDLELLTKEQIEKLIAYISEKFNQSIDFVKENLDKFGVPILQNDCSVWIKNPQRWFD